jgi:hypothetical protein
VIGFLEAVLALVGVVRSGRCRCGHPRDAHEHYRLGTDCSLCARPRYCQAYRSTWRRA